MDDITKYEDESIFYKRLIFQEIFSISNFRIDLTGKFSEIYYRLILSDTFVRIEIRSNLKSHYLLE